MLVQAKKAAVILALVMLSMALTSAMAQTALQSAQTTLTSEERASALQQFQTTRDNVLKSISGLSQKQWTFKPAPDRWSVAEVAEHIAVSESTIYGLVQKMMQSPATPEKREQVDGYQWLLLISAHSARHTAQIEEVKADPNFPKE
jgi:uncharacterized damage-inducible protein DinB